MKLSIIILSYNTKDYLKACIDSIYKNVKDVNYEIIVVDNYSTDGSRDLIRTHFKNVRLIENKDNYGFSKGNNIGAHNARGKYLLFLNSDTQIIRSNIHDAIYLADKENKIGVIGMSLKNYDGSYQRSFGSFYTIPNVILFLFGGDSLELLKYKIDNIRQVDWVSGACMFIKNDLFKKVNGFDEDFFMYLEDMELCYRIKRLGYQIIFDPKIEIMHVGQGSSNRTFAITQIYKGLLYFYKKHKSITGYVIIKIILITKAILAIFFGVIVGNSYLTKTYKKALLLAI